MLISVDENGKEIFDKVAAQGSQKSWVKGCGRI